MSPDRRLVAVLALLLGCAREPGPQTPPRADHAVGVTTMVFDDNSRPTPAHGALGGSPSRRLLTELWYPAAGEPSDDEQPGLSLDPAGAPYPLVIFVHGSTSFRRQSLFLMRALARRGFVVASADMPQTALGQPGGSTDQNVQWQPGDVSFLVSQLRAVAADATDPLHGAIGSAAPYAVIGHSTGGTVGLVTAFAPDAPEPRPAAVVALAPCACFFGDSFFATRPTPLLVIAGTNDRLVPYAANGRRAFEFATGPRAFALLRGGDHLRFTDIDADDLDGDVTTNEDDLARAFSTYGGGTCPPATGPSGDPAMSMEDQHRLTIELTGAFLDQHLQGRSDGFGAYVPDPLVSLERAP